MKSEPRSIELRSQDDRTLVKGMLFRAPYQNKIAVEVRSPLACDDILKVVPGIYMATALGRTGAVITVDGERFCAAPGEFNLICPYIDGDTSLIDQDDARKGWVVTPPEPQELFVREDWAVHDSADDIVASELDPHIWLERGLWYGYVPLYARVPPRGKLRKPQHMPRWAARRTITILSATFTERPDTLQWIWTLFCRKAVEEVQINAS